MGGMLTGTINVGQSGPGSNFTEGILHIPQTPWTRALLSDAV